MRVSVPFQVSQIETHANFHFKDLQAQKKAMDLKWIRF